MRRIVARSLMISLLLGSLPTKPAAARPPDASAEPAVPADPLTELLDARALKETRNPVVASFLAGEGSALVPEELRERALAQLRGALKAQTNVMGAMPDRAASADRANVSSMPSTIPPTRYPCFTRSGRWV
jgi:hypothetical protein